MADKDIIFSVRNLKSCEVDIPVQRRWHATQSTTAVMSIPATHSKATASNLALRNRVLITHPELGSWVGVMVTPQDMQSSIYSLSLVGAEVLLDGRVTNWNTTLRGTGGAIVKQLLELANAKGDTGIQPGYIDTASGGGNEKHYQSVKIGKTISELASELDMVAWISGSVENSRLALYLNYAKYRADVLSVDLIEGKNFAVEKISLEGSVANSITAIGKAKYSGDKKIPPMYTAVDRAAVNAGELIEDVVMAPDESSKSSLQALAESHLSKRKVGHISITGVIGHFYNDTRAASPFPPIGTQVRVKVSEQGKFNGNYILRVQEISYDPLQDVCAVTLKELNADE